MAEYALPKAYDFKETEKRIYQMWESVGPPPVNFTFQLPVISNG